VPKNKATRRVGLARALSKLGYCSRSKAAGLIRDGRVRLNGKSARDPETPVLEHHDHIAVDGTTIAAQKKIYLMMNKPCGIVTTASDEKGRQTVYDLLRATAWDENLSKTRSSWVAPVGRLDKASEGLLLLTNDSEWSARIAAPQSHLDKTYHVQIGMAADEDLLRALVRGVKSNGEVLRAKQVRQLRAGGKNCWLEIVLDEGRNRQIRRMMEALGVGVLRLVRVAIGALPLGELAKGQCRALTPGEKQMLDRALRARLW